jgi:hypothetical protein
MGLLLLLLYVSPGPGEAGRGPPQDAQVPVPRLPIDEGGEDERGCHMAHAGSVWEGAEGRGGHMGQARSMMGRGGFVAWSRQLDCRGDGGSDTCLPRSTRRLSTRRS